MDKSPGIFSWVELVTQDVEGSKKFYTELLGWETKSTEMPGGMVYETYMNGNKPVAGMIKAPEANMPTAWMNYITVEDLDATIEKAQALGAHLCVPAMDIPDMGRFAGIADPQGGFVCFWEFTK